MVPLSVASAVAILLTLVDQSQRVVASSGLNNLRHASSAKIEDEKSSSADVVQSLFASRSLRADVDLTQCYADMVVVADEANTMTSDAYFFFVDIMSNQWFSGNGIQSYFFLPSELRSAFEDLACMRDCANEINVEGANGQENDGS